MQKGNCGRASHEDKDFSFHPQRGISKPVQISLLSRQSGDFPPSPFENFRNPTFFRCEKGDFAIFEHRWRTYEASSLARWLSRPSRYREVEKLRPPTLKRFSGLSDNEYIVCPKSIQMMNISLVFVGDEAILGSYEGESARKTMFLSLSLPTC